MSYITPSQGWKDGIGGGGVVGLPLDSNEIILFGHTEWAMEKR